MLIKVTHNFYLLNNLVTTRVKTIHTCNERKKKLVRIKCTIQKRERSENIYALTTQLSLPGVSLYSCHLMSRFRQEHPEESWLNILALLRYNDNQAMRERHDYEIIECIFYVVFR